MGELLGSEQQDFSAEYKLDTVMIEDINDLERTVNRQGDGKYVHPEITENQYANDYYHQGIFKAKIAKHLGISDFMNLTPEQEESIDWEAVESVELTEEELLSIPNMPYDVEQAMMVKYKDQYGVITEESARNALYKSVIRNARRHAELPLTMTSHKNLYENKLLALMAAPEYSEENVSALIEEYTQLRLRGCMVNGEFAQRVKGSADGHLYMKVLRENIMKELNLTNEGVLSDLAYENMKDPKNFAKHFDLESALNMQSVNN